MLEKVINFSKQVLYNFELNNYIVRARLLFYSRLLVLISNLTFVSGGRFAEASMDGKGFDRVRRTEIGRKHFKLTHFEEVF